MLSPIKEGSYPTTSISGCLRAALRHWRQLTARDAAMKDSCPGSEFSWMTSRIPSRFFLKYC